MTVAVLTATLPERSVMLGELVESVAAQTHPCRHLIEVDREHGGNIPILNRLAEVAYEDGADWIMSMGDDDLLAPHHVAGLVGRARDDESVVYSLADVSSWPDHHGASSVNKPFNPDTFEEHNTIPGGATLIRPSLFREFGGWGPDRDDGDHELFVRMWKAGVKFRRVAEVTWTYRYHGQNMQERVHRP